jgi:hypothetical protein
MCGLDLIKTKSYFCSNLTCPVPFLLHDGAAIYREPARSHGDGWELRFSAYIDPIWTRFLSTASQWWDVTVMLTFSGEDGPQRAGDSGILQVQLGISELRLPRSLGQGNKRGSTRGARQCFSLKRQSSGGCRVAWQRELGLGFCRKPWRTGFYTPIYRPSASLSHAMFRVRWSPEMLPAGWIRSVESRVRNKAAGCALRRKGGGKRIWKNSQTWKS